jgi:hypothetical protein
MDDQFGVFHVPKGTKEGTPSFGLPAPITNYYCRVNGIADVAQQQSNRFVSGPGVSA